MEERPGGLRLTIINDTSLAVDVNLFSRENTRFMFTPSSEREESHVLLGLFISFNYPWQRACSVRGFGLTSIPSFLNLEKILALPLLIVLF
jgi:hypothetical protein